MKKSWQVVLIGVAFVLAVSISSLFAEEKVDNTSKNKMTTVIIVRHAEYDKSPAVKKDPPLTAQGELRAKTLAQILSQSGVSQVFSTDFTRTMETANNFAESKGLEIQKYEKIEDLAQQIRSKHQGEAILVVGHYHTFNIIVRALGLSSGVDPKGFRHSNMMIVSIASNGEASMLHLKYEVSKNIK